MVLCYIQIDGNHVRIDRACPPRKKQKGQDDAHLYDPKRTVFMGNLPFDVKVSSTSRKAFCSICDNRI